MKKKQKQKEKPTIKKCSSICFDKLKKKTKKNISDLG